MNDSELPESLVIMYFSDYGFSIYRHIWAKKSNVVPKEIAWGLHCYIFHYVVAAVPLPNCPGQLPLTSASCSDALSAWQLVGDGYDMTSDPVVMGSLQHLFPVKWVL